LLMSLFCERRATASQVPEPARRRGWIGNAQGDIQDFEIGSLLWLYYQSRLSSAVANGVESAAVECLKWLLDDDLANRIESETDFRGVSVDLILTIHVVNKPVEIRNFELWKNTGVVV